MPLCNIPVGFRWVVAAVVLLSFGSGCDQSSPFSGTGGQAPEFEFEPIGGKPQKLSDLRGKPVIVNFFATWCGPCMMELPELDRKIAKPFAERGLTVIAVGVDDKADDVADFQKSTKSAFQIVADPRSEIMSKFTQEGSIPQTFLIRPDGTIAMHLVGYDPNELNALKSQVEKLLTAEK